MLFENPLIKEVALFSQSHSQDSAHDFSHCSRVAGNALLISKDEGGDPEVLVLAALLHDIHNLPKDHPEAKKSSFYSAEAAKKWLQERNYPEEKITLVYDAILSHSYSLGKIPETLEGKILQDADRLEALGAIGIARCFMVTGANGSKIYSPQDPFHLNGRPLNDKLYAVDHFHQKLFKIVETMCTTQGRKIAEERVKLMHGFLKALEEEAHVEIEERLRAFS